MSITREKKDERVKGIEPSCAAWEAAVLPLNYTRAWKEVNTDCRLVISQYHHRAAHRCGRGPACDLLRTANARVSPRRLRKQSLPGNHVVGLGAGCWIPVNVVAVSS
jgi:hypothetical protein